MAFELRPSETVRRGFRRLARKELAAAREALDPASPAEKQIHAARKSIKKVRAVLQLIEADKGRGLGDARRRLRQVNRVLSGLRDADALIETLGMLQRHHPDLFSEREYGRMRRALVARRQKAVAAAGRDGAWPEIGNQLRVLRKLADGWHARHRGAGAMLPGVRDIMKRARKALARARKSNRAADFHEWRKETKALWYALRLVGGGSRPIASATRALHSAEQWLGEDHNLVILCATLTKDCVLRERPGDIERLHDAVGRSQARLRRQAISRTRVVFAVRPRDYAARVARAYRLRDRRGPCRRA